MKLEVVRVEVEEQETTGANLGSFRLWKPRDAPHAPRPWTRWRLSLRFTF